MYEKIELMMIEDESCFNTVSMIVVSVTAEY